VAVGVAQRKPVGPRRAVPHRENAAGVEGLSVDYQGVDGCRGGRESRRTGWPADGRGPGPGQLVRARHPARRAADRRQPQRRTQLRPLLDAIPPVRGRIGRPRPQHRARDRPPRHPARHGTGHLPPGR